MSVSLSERISNYIRSIRLKVRHMQLSRYARKNFRHSDTSRHIIISGIYRGGTTWLAEVLHEVTRYPVIWEPLHRKVCPEIIELGLDWKISIPPSSRADDVYNYLDQVIKGRILSRALIKLTNLDELSATRKLIIKFCRLNMSLPWFMNRFPDTRIIFLVRNPFAVVASQLEHPAWTKDFNFDTTFPVPKGKYTEAFQVHQKYLESLTTKTERLAADWCLDMQHVFTSNIIQDKRLLLVYYEDFLLAPETTMKRMLSFYNLDDVSTQDIAYTHKSFSSLENKKNIDPKVQINKWRNRLSEADIQKIYAVTEHFGVSYIYGLDDTPVFREFNNPG